MRIGYSLSPPVDLGFDAVSARGLVTFHGKGPDKAGGGPRLFERAGNGDGGGGVSRAVVLVDLCGDGLVDGFSRPADTEQDDGAKDGSQKNEGCFSLFAVHQIRLLMILHFYAECASEKRANPREGGGEGDVEQKVHEVRFFVVPEQLRGGDALDLGVKIREKVRVAQQHPVEKENVVDLHDIEDDEVAREKRAEGDIVPNAVLRGEDCRTEK